MLQSNLSWGGRSHGTLFFFAQISTAASLNWSHFHVKACKISENVTKPCVDTLQEVGARRLPERERERKMESCLCKVNSKAMKGFENARNRKKKCQRLSHRGGVISGSLRLLLTLCVLEPVQHQKPFTLILTSMDNLISVHLMCMSVWVLENSQSVWEISIWSPHRLAQAAAVTWRCHLLSSVSATFSKVYFLSL